jgi:hypothetical protein
MSVDLKDVSEHLITQFDTINTGYNLDYNNLKKIFAISAKYSQ